MVRKSLTLLALITLTSAAKADDWGCQVLLCLANPAGPMAAGGCVPPITRLYQALTKRNPDPFPSCDSANGSAVAKQGFNYFNACPSGTVDLPSGINAIQVSRSVYAGLAGNARSAFWTGSNELSWANVKQGIGSGEGGGFGDSGPGNKVCVGKELGPVYISVSGQDESASAVAVQAFEQVVTLEPNKSPRYIDVLIDNKPFTRSRF